MKRRPAKALQRPAQPPETIAGENPGARFGVMSNTIRDAKGRGLERHMLKRPKPIPKRRRPKP